MKYLESSRLLMEYFEGKNDIVYSLLHMHMNRVGMFPYRERGISLFYHVYCRAVE